MKKLYEDLAAIERSQRYADAVLKGRNRVLNIQNLRRGVINDLRNQVTQFRRGGGNPICVAVVGINQAEMCVGYEGDRPFPTTGRAGFLHPFQEVLKGKSRPAPLGAERLQDRLLTGATQ